MFPISRCKGRDLYFSFCDSLLTLSINRLNSAKHPEERQFINVHSPAQHKSPTEELPAFLRLSCFNRQCEQISEQIYRGDCSTQ
uniref:Uncharacterized protein n=1 Tax=Anguilla anguilla TaxID=7936 RepID=A0A0E9SBK1_ANGAN